MISLKKLVQLPGSPDIALKQQWKEAEAAPARIAHVNRLSRDIMDIKYYEVDLGGGNANTLKIDSKKGIVEITNYDPTVDKIFIALQNSEITQDRDKFYVQLTVYASNTAVPIIYGNGFASDTFNLTIKDLDATEDWGSLYFYYEIVKID